MPRFDRSRRYRNSKGQLFGEGVWLDDNGKVMRPGESYDKNNKDRTVTQYNSDGTKTVFSWENWASKNSKDNELRVLQNDRKFAIPYIPEKRMTISIDSNSPTRKNAGAAFSENMLDSVAVNAQKAGLPFSDAIGIIATESTFGKGERRTGQTMLPVLRYLNSSNSDQRNTAKSVSYKGYYSPSLLVSNWNQRNEEPFHTYFYDSQGQLRKTPKDAAFYDQDFNSARNRNDQYQLEEVSPLYHAFRQYAKDPNSYNSNDKDYPNKVAANKNELVNHSPEIREYMQKNNLKAEGGLLQPKDAWDRLSIYEKAAMMKVAVKNGIYNLQDIRQKYNEFAEGGGKEEEKYYTQMEKVAEDNYKDWGYNTPEEALVGALNDNTYNYREYYKNNPQSTANATTHWPDTYKTVYHPTFSVESIYSGQKSKYNPQGLYGGHWVNDDTFIPAPWQRGPLVEAAMNEYASGGKIHIKPSHRGRLTELKKRTGKSEAELYRTGGPAVRKMITFARNSRKWKHGEGGPLVENLFYPGGDIEYKFSQPFYSYDENGQLILDEDGKPILNYNGTGVLPEIVITPNRNHVSIDKLAKGVNTNSNYTVGEEARKAGEAAIREKNRRAAEEVARFNSQNEMHSIAPIDEVSGETVYESVYGPKVIGLSGADPIGEFYVAGTALGPLFKSAESIGYNIGNFFNNAYSIKNLSTNISRWSPEEAKEAINFGKYFFKKDVKPRLETSRRNVDNLFFTELSPYMSTIVLKNRPQKIVGETSPVVLEQNGTPYTISLNRNDSSPILDKYSTLIHELREDMINFHKGLYTDENQEAYKYMQELDEALNNKKMIKVMKMLPKYRKMRNALESTYYSKFLTPEEETLINNAYKLPIKPTVENSGKLNEKVSENTGYRGLISRMNGNVVGNDLDAVIDKMSEEDILDILSKGKSYGLDYRQYIEENPKERAQMIKNIKEALKKVGAFASISEGLSELITADDK